MEDLPLPLEARPSFPEGEEQGHGGDGDYLSFPEGEEQGHGGDEDCEGLSFAGFGLEDRGEGVEIMPVIQVRGREGGERGREHHSLLLIL